MSVWKSAAYHVQMLIYVCVSVRACVCVSKETDTPMSTAANDNSCGLIECLLLCSWVSVCVFVGTTEESWRKSEEEGGRGRWWCLNHLRGFTSGHPAVVGVFWATCLSKPWVCLVLLSYNKVWISVFFLFWVQSSAGSDVLALMALDWAGRVVFLVWMEPVGPGLKLWQEDRRYWLSWQCGWLMCIQRVKREFVSDFGHSSFHLLQMIIKCWSSHHNVM